MLIFVIVIIFWRLENVEWRQSEESPLTPMFSRRDAANKKPAPQKVSEPGINFWVHQSVTDRIWDNFCNCVHCHRNPGQNKFKSNVSLTELTEVILILLLRWKVFLKFCTYYVRQIWPFKRCLRMYKFAWFFSFARNMLRGWCDLCKFVVQIFWGDMCWEVWFVQIPPLPCHNCQKCSLLRICKLAQVCSPLCICHQQHLLCSFPTQSWTIQIMPSEMEVVRFSNWLGCNFKFLKFQNSPRNWLPTHRPRETGKESGLRSLLLARYPCYWNCNPWYWISIVIVIGIVQVSTWFIQLSWFWWICSPGRLYFWRWFWFWKIVFRQVWGKPNHTQSVNVEPSVLFNQSAHLFVNTLLHACTHRKCVWILSIAFGPDQ